MSWAPGGDGGGAVTAGVVVTVVVFGGVGTAVESGWFVP